MVNPAYIFINNLLFFLLNRFTPCKGLPLECIGLQGVKENKKTLAGRTEETTIKQQDSTEQKMSIDVTLNFLSGK